MPITCISKSTQSCTFTILIADGKPQCVSLSTGCYVFHSGSKGFNWYKARQMCRDWQMKLVTIETEQEQHVLNDYISSTLQLGKIG